jgi:hypothetical protein
MLRRSVLTEIGKDRVELQGEGQSMRIIARSVMLVSKGRSGVEHVHLLPAS